MELIRLRESSNWKSVFKVSIDGVPPTLNSLYSSTPSHRRRFKVKKALMFQDIVEQAALKFKKENKLEIIKDKWLMYKIDLYFGDRRKRDNANYEKCLIDSLSGLIFEDDSQFKVTLIEKHYDPLNPRTEVEILVYEVPKENIIAGMAKVKETLGLADDKTLAKQCRHCLVMYYWVLEGIEPKTDRIIQCKYFIRRNSEQKCPIRPRKLQISPFIGEELNR